MRISAIVFSILAAVLLTACRNNDLIVNNPHPSSSGRGAVIVNEGAYPNAGTISYYNISKDSVFQNIVGTAAGWVTPNDVKIVGAKAYIVVNGNDKIEVLNTETFQSSGSVSFSPGTSPGFICIADSTTAYVANYSGTVSLVNLLSDSVVRTSGSVVAFPGGVAVSSGKVYVSDYGLYPDFKNTVKVLDAATLNLLDTISVGTAAGMMAKGSPAVLYIVCAGNYPSKGKVYAINTGTDAVEDSLEVGLGPSDIAENDHLLYVLHGDRVMRLGASPLSLVDTAFVTLSGGLYYYALNVDESSGDIYVSKIVGTGGSGEIEIYTSAGSLKRTPFAVGLFPGAFAFKQ